MIQHWNAQKALEDWISNNKTTCINKKKKAFTNEPLYFYQENETIPIAELESLVYKTAKLVDELGTDYIDLFHRAEKELEKAQQNLNTLERIRNITAPSKSSDLKSNLIEPKSLLFQAWSASVSGTDIFMSH